MRNRLHAPNLDAVKMTAIAALDMLTVVDHDGTQEEIDLAIKNMRTRCQSAYPDAFNQDGKVLPLDARPKRARKEA